MKFSGSRPSCETSHKKSWTAMSEDNLKSFVRKTTNTKEFAGVRVLVKGDNVIPTIVDFRIVR